MTKSRILLSITVFFIISSTVNAADWKTVTVSDFTLDWQVDGDSLNLRVSAPTEGWVAVGFDPSKAMKDANILIGYVENGSAFVEDHFGNGVFSHRDDISLGGTANVSNISGSESNGVTNLSYTIPMNSGDSKDKALREGETYKVIFASNKRDKITAKHNRRTSVEITL